MKPEAQSWHEYLKGYGGLVWRRPDDEHLYHELIGLMQPLYSLLCGNLLESTGPKIVIATPTPKPVQAKGHAPFSFKVQCLITGRLSRIIPYERLVEFGVLTHETTYPGGYQNIPLEIEDKISPVIGVLQERIASVRPLWVGVDTPWHVRYDEYLQSEQWLMIRAQVLRRDGYRCRMSGKVNHPGDPLQVHHLTYDRVGCESLDDLIAICRSTHRKLHGAVAVNATQED
jgi:hypothetical protein